MTNEEMILGGAILGGMFATIMIFLVVFYILTVIAGWKILTKAGEKGWKILIPIYNYYMLYKIAGVNFWIWFFIPTILIGVINSVSGDGKDMSIIAIILVLIVLIYTIVGICKFCKGLAASFGKGTSFAVGLFFLPNIFQLILGFGSAKYEK